MLSKRISQIKGLIAEGKIQKAISGLMTILEDSDQEYDAILQSARYNELAKLVQRGKISPGDASIGKNQITDSILGIIGEIEKSHQWTNKSKDYSLGEEEEFIKLSDKLAAPVIRAYQAGGFALIFIFIGMVLIFTAQFNQEGIYSTWIFGLGMTLIIISFLIFLYLQLNNPITSKSKINQGKEIVDELQNLSIDLVRLTSIVQALSFKHLNEINGILEKALPIIQNLPLIGSVIKEKGVKLKGISSSIVEYSAAVEETIRDVETALVSSDVEKFKGYAEKVRGFSLNMNQVLKK